MQMLCNKATPGDDYFYQVATLKLSAEANLTIAVYDNVTVYGDVSNLDLNVNGYYNNTVKVSAISITKDNAEFAILAKVI